MSLPVLKKLNFYDKVLLGTFQVGSFFFELNLRNSNDEGQGIEGFQKKVVEMIRDFDDRNKVFLISSKSYTKGSKVVINSTFRFEFANQSKIDRSVRDVIGKLREIEQKAIHEEKMEGFKLRNYNFRNPEKEENVFDCLLLPLCMFGEKCWSSKKGSFGVFMWLVVLYYLLYFMVAVLIFSSIVAYIQVENSKSKSESWKTNFEQKYFFVTNIVATFLTGGLLIVQNFFSKNKWIFKRYTNRKRQGFATCFCCGTNCC